MKNTIIQKILNTISSSDKVSGVYCIQNLKTRDKYIGSSCNIRKRIGVHLRELKKGKHHSKILQRAYDKYTIDNFIFYIIELNDTPLISEQYYLDLLKPKYNISLNAIAPMLGRKHSKHTLSLFKKRKTTKGLTHPHYGKKATMETRKKQSEIRKKFKWSDEVKSKMSKTAKRINSIGRVNWENIKKKIKDSNGYTHDSLTSAAKYYNISKSAICDNLKGRSKKTRIGVTFEYI